MHNPIEWLFRDPSLCKTEEEFDRKLKSIKKKIKDTGREMLIEVELDFPKKFTEQSEKISSGNLEWRDFYSNRTVDIYSVHCRMEKGTLLREHRHPRYDEYIYVVSGSIVNYTNGDAKGRIIAPPEKIDLGEPNIESWHKIPAGTSHRIQALEDNTHFVSKFLKSSNEPN